MNKPRIIRIKLSATGRGLQKEGVEMELKPMEDRAAVELLKRIVGAVNKEINAKV